MSAVSTLLPFGSAVSTEFSRWFHRQLARHEMSQAEFSRRTGFSTGQVSMWAKGERNPSPRSIEKIADVLFADQDEVLAIAGHRPRLPMEHLERWHSLIDPYLRKLEFSELNQADLTDNLARMIKMQEMQAGTRRPDQYNDPVELEEE